MKKLVLGLCLVGLALCGIAMMFRFGYNVGYAEAKDEDTITCELTEDRNAAFVPSDEESIERRVCEDFGAEYYGELISNERPGVIEFMVYDSKGIARYTGVYERFSTYTTYVPTANEL